MSNTVSQQILDSLTDIYSAMSTLASRVGSAVAFILTEPLNTNGHDITNPTPDDDDYAPPIVIRSHSGIDAFSRDGFAIHKAALPQMRFVAPPADGVIGVAYDGLTIAAAPTAPIGLTLSADIPAPDGEARWSCMLINESLTPGAIIGVTAPDVLLNGAYDEIAIDPGEARIVSRGPSGFRLI